MRNEEPLPISLTGDWRPVSQVGNIRWEGQASGPVPITGFILSYESGLVRWARIDRTESKVLTVSLSLFGASDGDRRHVRLAASAGGQSLGLAGIAADIRLTSLAPFDFRLLQVTTERVKWFAHIRSEPKLRVGLLLIRESDTRSARKHSWHLREGFSPGAQPLGEALKHGRSGEFPISDPSRLVR